MPYTFKYGDNSRDLTARFPLCHAISWPLRRRSADEVRVSLLGVGDPVGAIASGDLTAPMLNVSPADPYAYILLGVLVVFQIPRFLRSVLAFLRDWDDYKANRPRR